MHSMFRTAAAACIAVTLSVVSPATAPLITRAESGSAHCLFNGSGTVSPAVTYQERSVQYTFTGTLGCVSSDPTLNAGDVTAAGSGLIGCFRGDHSAVLSVAWNNGKTSSLRLHFTDTVAALVGTGTVGRGEFEGQGASADLLFYGPDALNCASAGISSASISGYVQVG
jgi:hypothetical protein